MRSACGCHADAGTCIACSASARSNCLTLRAAVRECRTAGSAARSRWRYAPRSTCIQDVERRRTADAALSRACYVEVRSTSRTRC